MEKKINLQIEDKLLLLLNDLWSKVALHCISRLNEIYIFIKKKKQEFSEILNSISKW